MTNKIIVEDYTTNEGKMALALGKVSTYIGALAKSSGMSIKELTELALMVGEETCALFKLAGQISDKEEKEIRESVEQKKIEKINSFKELGLDKTINDIFKEKK
jgi:hypothetical protein